ncbi:pyridoxine 5'-phosphate synthase [Arenicella chitinivorans]|uniref:Pyridoxine 5'-phosphate synthase n=1 Tax=Arenicella chitinivorans TaxID=1329800 RepID=A0A918RT14_9GAMM|nr:pyridoxine 5'-phosphate synthase [Arenicella chitinivorans]GHA09091.1 pyridoxine 5'-phosphate synthase [Arenicella chitinivorans]
MSQPHTEHHVIELGVNVDHIATLRQARGTTYPCPVQAADIARQAGADGVTVHLREDRRHIQDQDVYRIRREVALPMNLEMATTKEMLEIALQVLPKECCLVPEKRSELTTEGGLDVLSQVAALTDYVGELSAAGIMVSLFIDPEPAQIEASKHVGAAIVELHTGQYADAQGDGAAAELIRIRDAAKIAHALGMQVNAGHGLHYQNVVPIAQIPEVVCLNIGHAIVSRAAITGFYEAVFAMKQIMNGARLDGEGAGL